MDSGAWPPEANDSLFEHGVRPEEGGKRTPTQAWQSARAPCAPVLILGSVGRRADTPEFVTLHLRRNHRPAADHGNRSSRQRQQPDRARLRHHERDSTERVVRGRTH